MHKRGHAVIYFRRFPIGSGFALKAKRGKGSIVGSTPCNSCGKQIGVTQQIGHHKCAIAMSPHGHSVGVCIAFIDHRFDGSSCVGYQLGTKAVIGFFIAFSHNGKSCSIEYHIPLGNPVNWRSPKRI